MKALQFYWQERIKQDKYHYSLYLFLSGAFLLFPSFAFAATSTDLKQAILDVVATLIQVSLPFCFIIGIFKIFGGFKRLADGNSSPHGGKGGIGKIIAGTCLMQVGTVYSVLQNTLEPIFTAANITSTTSTGTANTNVVTAVETTGTTIIGALMGVVFITGCVYVGKGIFMFSHSEGGGRNTAWDAGRHVIVGVIFLSFGVALGVAKSTINTGTPP